MALCYQVGPDQIGASHAESPRHGWLPRRGGEFRGYLDALIFAHLALWAATIRLRPAADRTRFGFRALTCPLPAARLAQRAFCARLIFLRAEADKVRLGFA